MPAFDDRCRPVVSPDSGVQLGEIAPIAFRDQDVGGPSQIFGRFAKGSAWQEKLVAERGLPVDQYNVKTPMESQILQTVVEDQ